MRLKELVLLIIVGTSCAFAGSQVGWTGQIGHAVVSSAGNGSSGSAAFKTTEDIDRLVAMDLYQKSWYLQYTTADGVMPFCLGHSAKPLSTGLLGLFYQNFSWNAGEVANTVWMIDESGTIFCYDLSADLPASNARWCTAACLALVPDNFPSPYAIKVAKNIIIVLSIIAISTAVYFQSVLPETMLEQERMDDQMAWGVLLPNMIFLCGTLVGWMTYDELDFVWSSCVGFLLEATLAVRSWIEVAQKIYTISLGPEDLKSFWRNPDAGCSDCDSNSTQSKAPGDYRKYRDPVTEYRGIHRFLLRYRSLLAGIFGVLCSVVLFYPFGAYGVFEYSEVYGNFWLKSSAINSPSTLPLFVSTASFPIHR